MTDEKEKDTIKSLYIDMQDIAKLNNPEIFLMPTSLYNQIMKKIVYLEEALINARKGRDEFKRRLRETKK